MIVYEDIYYESEQYFGVDFFNPVNAELIDDILNFGPLSQQQLNAVDFDGD